MKNLSVLVIGGGIGWLTAAIAQRRDGHEVTVIEKDPTWSVYGMGGRGDVRAHRRTHLKFAGRCK